MRQRRGANSGLTPYSQLRFRSDLQQSLISQVSKGVATPTFTRATTASVPDFEGIVRTALSGESRFKGARRVENLFTSQTATLAISANQTVTVAIGTYVFSMGAGASSGVCTFTGTASGSTGTLTQNATSRTSTALTITSAGTIICTGTTAILVDIQIENTTGQANQNPSEYVSSGVLSAPYHGANVDAVQYFNTLNGNTVASNVVTEATGGLINFTNAPKSVYFDGAAGSYASTPDSPANSITSSFCLLAYVYATDFMPTADETIAGKYLVTGNQRSLVLQINGVTGYLRLLTSATGGAAVQSLSTVKPTIPSGAPGIWVGVIWNDAADVANYYTSNQPRTTASTDLALTLLGDADIAHASAGIFDSTALFEIGSYNSGASGNFSGTVDRAILISGTDPSATPAVSFNANDAASPSGDGDTFTTVFGLSSVPSPIEGSAFGYTFSGDTITRNGSTGGASVNMLPGIIAGVTYDVSFSINGKSGDDFFIRVGSTPATIAVTRVQTDGDYSFTLTATSADRLLIGEWAGGTPGEFTMTNLSVKQANTFTLHGGATVPLYNYDASGPFGYMSEAAATNLATYSTAFENAAWAKSNVTATDGDAASPTGASTATLLLATAANGTVIQDLGSISSAAHIGGLWIKRKTGTGNIDLTINNGSTWTTVAVTTTWTRFATTSVTAADPDVGIRLAVDTDAVWVWNGSAEAGTFLTSDTPTTTAAVTRNADVLTYDDTGNISDTAGTAVCDASTDWSASPANVTAIGRSNGVLYQLTGANSPTIIRSSDASNTSVSVAGTSMFNAPQTIASAWGAELTAYSPATLQPDASPAAYSAAGVTGDIGIGCYNLPGNFWGGTIRNVKIFDVEKSAAEVVLL